MSDITLVSNDGQHFKIKKQVVMASLTVKSVVEDCAGEDGEMTEPIPLRNVNATTLKKILEYCEHYNGNPPVDENPQASGVEIEGFDATFIDIPQPLLFELILGANYMGITPLLNLGCKRVASMLKSKTTEEIRKNFNIIKDFTPEEEEEVKRENAWVEDPSLPN